MRAILTLVALACVAAGCAHRPEPTSAASVMQADRDFAARAAAAGLQTAFIEYAAPDAVIFRAGVGPIRGSAAIGEAFAGTGNETLAWEPAAADVAASGDLAYTWGWYTFTADGKSS